MIALLSTKAEYVTLSEGLREIMWLRQLYGELGYEQNKPTLLFGDKMALLPWCVIPNFINKVNMSRSGGTG